MDEYKTTTSEDIPPSTGGVGWPLAAVIALLLVVAGIILMGMENPGTMGTDAAALETETRSPVAVTE